jgi:hypothetical protein
MTARVRGENGQQVSNTSLTVTTGVAEAYRFGGDSGASYLLHRQKHARALPIWPDICG